jgi:hypothetical protein
VPADVHSDIEGLSRQLEVASLGQVSRDSTPTGRSSSSNSRGILTPRESSEDGITNTPLPEPDVFIRPENFKRAIELSDVDCTLEDDDEELQRIRLENPALQEVDLPHTKHWKICLESDTNLRFLTNAIPSGTYRFIWRFAYKIDPAQPDLEYQMIQYNCTSGFPVNSSMFLSRITDPSQPYISTGLTAIFKPFTCVPFYLPLIQQLPKIDPDTYVVRMKRQATENLVNPQIITIEDNQEFAFLVKRVKYKPALKGCLIFLGVVLSRQPDEVRPYLIL